MNPAEDPSRSPSGRSPFEFMRRRREAAGRPFPVAAGVLVLVLIGGAVAWYVLRSPPEPQPQVAVPTIPVEPAPVDSSLVVPLIDLPPLDASDAIVRELVSRLSAHPRIAEWLVSDDLVRRFVSAVVNLAGGRSPSPHVGFLAPAGDFSVQASGEDTLIDPASYARYDLLVGAFTSLDTRGSAVLYQQLRPLFVEAHTELGLGDRSWDDAVVLAVGNVLAARVSDGPVRVREEEGLYVFMDPALESGTDAEKHLIRAGSENARRIQAKLRELAAAIGIQPPA